jgi:sugar O-acyltransferase (sialic acid O-acetyltransferase NeuD family)
MNDEITYIVGCGGHGCVILDILRSTFSPSAPMDSICFLDDRESMRDKVVDGAPVAGDIGLLREGSKVLIGVGDNIARRNLFYRFRQRGCVFPRLIAPSAVVSPAAVVEEGAVIFARAVVQTGASVGANAVINTAAVVEHDCRIARHVQLAPMVALSGNVTVGEGTLLGTGVSVNKNVSIGQYCLISPGLPVIKDVPDHSVYKVDPAGVLVERNYRLDELAPHATG